MDTKDFRRVALNPYYEFSVEVPLSRYGVCFEDYRKAFQAGFRTAHRYWDGIEDGRLRDADAPRAATSFRRWSFGHGLHRRGERVFHALDSRRRR